MPLQYSSTPLQNIPGIEDHPEVLELLDSPQFDKPGVLKQTIVEGISTMKIYARQMSSVMGDQQTRQQLLGDLPLDMRIAIDGLFEGDYEAVRTFLENQTPAIEQANIDIIMSLLEGDAEALQGFMGNLLGDAGQVEQTRQMLLDNPDMAEAMGVDLKMVRNEREWRKMIAEAQEQLGGDGLDGLREKASSAGTSDSGRKFRIPGMA